MKRVVYALALSLAFAAPAAAHHGKDFLLAESAELPHPKTMFFVSSERFSNSEFTSEPSLLFGITPNFAGEVHVHFTRDGYQAVAPAIHVQRTVELHEERLQPRKEVQEIGAAGLRKEVVAEEKTLDVPVTREEVFVEHHPVEPHPANRPIGEGQIVINAGTDAAYAVGYRPDMESHTSWGIEAQGQLRHGEEHQLIFGLYTQPMERLTIKVGAGAILGTGKPGAVLRTGIVWSF